MTELEKRVLRAVRIADYNLEQFGGDTKDWVMDYFIPALAENNLKLIETNKEAAKCQEE